MERNTEKLKQNIMKKLPEILPKVVKSVVVHIVMFIYHISMPPWVTVLKIKKAVGNHNTNDTDKKSVREMRSRRRDSRRNRRENRYLD